MRVLLISLCIFTIALSCESKTGAYDSYTSPGNAYEIVSFPFNSDVGVVCAGQTNYFKYTFSDNGYVSFAVYFPENDIDIYVFYETESNVIASSESGTLNEALYTPVNGLSEYYFRILQYGPETAGLNYTAFIDFSVNVPCQTATKKNDIINPDNFPTYTKWLCGKDYDVYTVRVDTAPYNLTLDFEFDTALKLRFTLLDSNSNYLNSTGRKFFTYLIETAGNYTLMVNQTADWYGNYTIVGNAPITTTSTTSTTSSTSASTSSSDSTSTSSSTSTSTSSSTSSTSSSSSSVTSSTATAATSSTSGTISTTGLDNETDSSTTALLTLEFSTDTGSASKLIGNIVLLVICFVLLYK